MSKTSAWRSGKSFEALLLALPEDVSDDEAWVLVGALGPDTANGLMWELVHRIEKAPGWPFQEVFDDRNEGLRVLRIGWENSERWKNT